MVRGPARPARIAAAAPAAAAAALAAPLCAALVWAALHPTGRAAWPLLGLAGALAVGVAAAGGRTPAATARSGDAGSRPRPTRPPPGVRIAAVTTVLVVTAALMATLSPTTDATDSVEFQIVARTLRIAHAPGYPLYTLLGHIAAWLPVGDVAWRLNLLSAAAGVVGAALAFALGHRLTGDALSGVVAALSSAWMPQLWSQAVITEVYTLHVAIVLAILYGLARLRPSPPRGPATATASIARADARLDRPRGRPHPRASDRTSDRWRLAVLVLCGLGFTHHLTTVLLYPVVALVVLAREPGLLRRGRRVAACAAALAAGLLPLAYLPWRWRAVNGTPPDVATILGYATGRNYPGLLDIGRVAEDPARFGLAAHQYVDALGPALLVVAAVGAAALARRRRVMALALALVAGAFTVFYLGYYAWDGWVVLLPALVVAALAAGAGTAALAGARPSPRRAAVAALAAVALAAGVARVGPRADASRGWPGQAAANAALAAPIPAGARLVVEPTVGAGFLFARHLAGVRSDLDVVYADWPAGRDALDDPLGGDRPVVTYGVAPRAAWLGRTAPRAIGPLLHLAAPGEAPLPPGLARVPGTAAPSAAAVRPVAARLGDPPWGTATPAVRAGEGLPLTIAWAADRPAAFTAFVRWRRVGDRHGDGGRDHAAPWTRVAPLPDSALTAAWPPDRWPPGDVVVDRRVAATFLDWPPGTYALDVGVTPDSAAGDGAAPAPPPASWWPVGEVAVRGLTRHDLARAPDLADVIPVRAARRAGVALVGVRAPAGARPGTALRVDAVWSVAPEPWGGRGGERPGRGLWRDRDVTPASAASDAAFTATLALGEAISSVEVTTTAATGSRTASGVDPARTFAAEERLVVTRHVVTPSVGAAAVRWGRPAAADVRLSWRAAGDATAPTDPTGRARGAGSGGGHVRLGAIAWRTDSPGLDRPVVFDGGLQLARFEPTARIVRPGAWLRVRTGWEAIGPARPRLKAFVQVLDADQNLRASSDREVRYGAQPTDAWRDGERVDDTFFVRLPDDMPAGPAWLQVGLYDKQTQRRSRVVVDSVPGDDRFLTGIFVRRGAPAAATTAADVAFDGGPRLTGIAWSPAAAGAAAALRLTWRVDVPARRDWTVFVHVVAPGAAEPVAQADGMPFGSIFPTRLWPRGAVLTSDHALDAGALPPGAALAIGLYDAATGERAVPSGDVAGGVVEADARRVVVPLSAITVP